MRQSYTPDNGKWKTFILKAKWLLVSLKSTTPKHRVSVFIYLKINFAAPPSQSLAYSKFQKYILLWSTLPVLQILAW